MPPEAACVARTLDKKANPVGRIEDEMRRTQSKDTTHSHG